MRYIAGNNDPIYAHLQEKLLLGILEEHRAFKGYLSLISFGDCIVAGMIMEVAVQGIGAWCEGFRC